LYEVSFLQIITDFFVSGKTSEVAWVTEVVFWVTTGAVDRPAVHM
jgi:hypothetical protein